MILRAGERYRSSQPGIETRHCFSAGAHYDPANVAFGPLVGVDEHWISPGAGFGEHAHRGVEIISWVAEGVLHHRSGDVDQLINAGESLIQDGGEGFRHTERNGSESEPLRLIQTTLLAGSGVEFDALRSAGEVQAPWLHLFVAEGSWTLDGLEFGEGDSARLTDEVLHAVSGSGTLLLLRRS